VEEIRSRRSLLRAAGYLIPLAFAPLPALARTRSARQLSFYHTHTSEKLDVVYAEGGAYIPGALAEINYLLRDFRSGDVHAIDPRLLDILHDVRDLTASSGHFEVISGFRSPATNQQLRHNSSGVARNSLHLKGQAIDVRLTGAATRNLRRAAIAMRKGGVGYYPGSDFVHLDTGRVRTW
jgi:uncharacterized protein YcbK (DUF882 family)